MKSLLKSASKTVTWRGVAAVDTLVIAFVMTGHLGTAVTIVGTEIFTKSALYFFHERLWELRVFQWFNREDITHG